MERFAHSPVGQLVPIEVPAGNEMARQLAFVPSSLPDELTLSQATWSAAMNAGIELGQLAGMTRGLKVEPALLAGLTVRREARRPASGWLRIQAVFPRGFGDVKRM